MSFEVIAPPPSAETFGHRVLCSSVAMGAAALRSPAVLIPLTPLILSLCMSCCVCCK